MKYPKPSQLKKTRKLKKPSRKSIITRLDKLTSQYVLKRDGGRCVMCKSDVQVGCGHVFSRRFYSIRWNPLNCHAQCWRHNFAHNRNPHPYTHWFLTKFGQDAYDTLFELSKEITHYKTVDLERIEANLQVMLIST